VAFSGREKKDEDIVEMLICFEGNPSSSYPCHFLVPIPGTPFEKLQTGLTPLKCLKILCLTRFINPQSEVRAAGGWEFQYATT